MIDFKLVEAAFDKWKVLEAANKMKAVALRTAGGFIRTKARTIIGKPTKGTKSSPGQPPKGHTDLLRKMIFYEYDPMSSSVVCGPMKAEGKNPLIEIPSTTGAALLEFGGSATSKRTKRRMTYKARPYMGPALVLGLQEMQTKKESLWKLVGPGSGMSANVEGA